MRTVWGKFKRFFGGSSRQISGTANAPILIRVVDEKGRSVPVVHVEAIFSPSGRTVRGRRITAQGLCLFPWGRDETKADISVQVGDIVAKTQIDRASTDRSRKVVLLGVGQQSQQNESNHSGPPLPVF